MRLDFLKEITGNISTAKPLKTIDSLFMWMHTLSVLSEIHLYTFI